MYNKKERTLVSIYSSGNVHFSKTKHGRRIRSCIKVQDWARFNRRMNKLLNNGWVMTNVTFTSISQCGVQAYWIKEN